MRESRTLPGRPESARAAREFTAGCLPGCPSVYEAMLLTDELVANACQHSRSGLPGGEVTVRVVTEPGEWLRVEVEDQGPHLRAVPGDPDELAESGRGLLLVSVLADTFGADHAMRWFWMAWDRGAEACAAAPRPPARAPAELRRSPELWELRRRAVLDRSGGMCQCAGQCGRAGHRCAYGDAPGHLLHIVPADPAGHDTAAAALPAGDLIALCEGCRAGRDRITARARAAAAAAPDALFAVPAPGGQQ